MDVDLSTSPSASATTSAPIPAARINHSSIFGSTILL
jgi:hypothetical protein